MSGHDVFYDKGIDRAGLLRVARDEKRTVITRAGNYRELKNIPPYLIVVGDDLDEQLIQVYKAYPDLDPFADLFSKCVECNVPTQEIDKEKYKDQIPPKAMQLEGRFTRCPSCGKILWPGTHVDRIKEKLNRLFSKP